MQCHDAQALLTGYLSDEAAPAERREFEEHVAACACCRDELASFRQTWDLVGHWPIPALDPRIERDFLAKLERETATAGSRPRLVPATVAALLAVLLSVAASMFLTYEQAFELCRRTLQGLSVLGGLSDSPLFFVAGLFYGVIPLLLVGLMIARLTDGGGPLLQGTATSVAFALLMTPYVLIVCSALPGAFIAAILAGIWLGGFSGGVGGFWLGARRWRPAV